MSCEVYLFRREYVSYDAETDTDLVKQQKFWCASSWKLGISFAETLGIAEGCWKSVTSDEFLHVSQQMIADGEDDCGEYPDGALKAVVDDLEELDQETKRKSHWFVTLDY